MGALEDGYWLNHDAEARAWHAKEVMRARAERSLPHVAARPRPVQGVTELLVYAGDRPGLFASLASAISAGGANIMSARVYTTRDGAAFDLFTIQTTDGKPFGLGDRRTLDAMIERLTRAALENVPPPQAPPPSRRARAFSIEPWVRLDNNLTPDASVVEASGRDRPGLLAALAHVFAKAHISIASAHIDTYGERASDVFYVQEAAGGQIVSPARAALLQAELEAALRAAEPAAANDPAKAPLAVAPASTAR
jgi:[protein-PII] uridylyltransferase